MPGNFSMSLGLETDDRDLVTVANIATSVAVIIAVVFGVTELRRGARERRDRAAVEVVPSVQTQESFRAVGKILNLPDDADPEVIRSDPAMLDAAMLVYFACEMLGSIVFEGVVELEADPAPGKALGTHVAYRGKRGR